MKVDRPKRFSVLIISVQCSKWKQMTMLIHHRIQIINSQIYWKCVVAGKTVIHLAFTIKSKHSISENQVYRVVHAQRNDDEHWTMRVQLTRAMIMTWTRVQVCNLSLSSNIDQWRCSVSFSCQLWCIRDKNGSVNERDRSNWFTANVPLISKQWFEYICKLSESGTRRNG